MPDFESNGNFIAEDNFGKLKKVQIDWHDLTVSVMKRVKWGPRITMESGPKNKNKTILSKCTGSAQPGQIMAVMGSSGAGKSTFMNALTYRNTGGLEIQGSVKACGIALKGRISKISAYIQQDDHFLGALNVKEHLQFHADLRLHNESRAMRNKVVENVIRIVGLQDCIDTIIGTPGLTKTISGGEMKRLSIATEILTDPPVIIADEPTSGLDSRLALSVVKTLKSLASTGTTVICTIHQPSSETFDEFDSILLLSMGRTAFCGPIKQAKSFFMEIGKPVPPHYNPADHFVTETSKFNDFKEEIQPSVMIAISTTVAISNTVACPKIKAYGYDRTTNEKLVIGICDDYMESQFAFEMESHQIQDPDENSIKDKIKMSCRPNVFYIFWKIFCRGMVAKYRDKPVMRIKVIQTLILALIYGLLFCRWWRPTITSMNPTIHPYNPKDVFNSNGAMFAFVCNTSFNYMLMVIVTFPQMGIILKREYYSGLYQLPVAITAEMLVSMPYTIVMPIIFGAITYFLAGLTYSVSAFFFHCFTLFQIAFCASGFGYFISAISPSVEAATAIAPPMMMLLLLFGGFFIQIDTLSIYLSWIKYISWFYLGNENLYINQWKENGYCDNTLTIKSSSVNTTLDALCEKFYPGSSWTEGSVQLEYFGFNEEHLGRNIGLLFTLAIVFRILALVVLSNKY